MHLTVCLNASGYHAAGWRLSGPAELKSQFKSQSLNAASFRALVALAERAGFAAALFGLSFQGEQVRATGRVPCVAPDALPLVAALIAATRAIGLGATYRLDRAEPFNVARALATLDRHARGRTAGIVAREHLADTDRAAECIEVARKLWDSWEDEAFAVDKPRGLVADSSKVHRIDHAGAHFSVRGPLNVPRPTQGHPVLVMTDPGDREGRELAAVVADVILINCADTASARTACDEIRASAAAASRGPLSLRVLPNVFAVLGANDAEAEARRAELHDAIEPDLARALAESGRRETLGALSFVGTPERLADQLADWHAETACDGFNILPSTLPHDLRLIADRATPELRHAGAAGATLCGRLGLAHPRSRYAPA